MLLADFARPKSNVGLRVAAESQACRECGERRAGQRRELLASKRRVRVASDRRNELPLGSGRPEFLARARPARAAPSWARRPGLHPQSGYLLGDHWALTLRSTLGN
jgi:hypothetical protein